MAIRAKRQAKATPKAAARESTGEALDGDDVSDRICATLAAAISEGALKPGSKILEDAIAEHFGVSRTVVRGALGVLQSDHLLERKRNRGTFVAEPSVADAKQLFEARRALERTILEMVVGRASASQLDRLDAMAEEEKRIHAGGDESVRLDYLGTFHLELAALSGNAVLTELLGKVVARLSLVMALYEEERSDECGADEHLAVVAALRREDQPEALRLMDEHLADHRRPGAADAESGRPALVRGVLASFSGK